MCSLWRTVLHDCWLQARANTSDCENIVEATLSVQAGERAVSGPAGRLRLGG